MKRIICIILTLCMLSASVLAAPSFSDTDGNDYSSEIEMLKRLNIMNGYQDGSFRPKEKLTRAEFAQIISDMMNFDVEHLVEYNDVFSDVSEKDWFANAISYVNSMKFMVGYGNGEFKPNNNITVAETAMALINVLGYKHEAQNFARAPIAAKRIGLTKGLSDVPFDSFITRECAAKMVANAIDIDMCEVTGYGNEMVMEVIEGATILYRYHNVIKGEDVVQANDLIAISGALAPENNIRIGSVIMEYEDSRVRNMVGMEVTFMYKFNDAGNKNTLIYIEETDDNKMIEVDIADYVGFADNTFEYYDENGRTRSITVSLTADVFKNNEFFEYSGNPFDEIKEGEVRFISSNQSSVYDVVFITEYKTYIAESINGDTRTIVNKLDSSDNLDLSDEEIALWIFDGNGKEISFEDIKKGDVITAIMGTESIELYISDKSIQGLTQKSSDSIVVDGVEYKINGNVKDKYPDLRDAENSATFYLDSRDKIVHYENAFDGEIIYLLRIAPEEGALNKTVLGRFFSMKDGLKVYKFERDVTVNGKRQKNVSLATLADELDSIKEPGNVEGVVLIKLNDAGNINSIEVPKSYKECMEADEDAFCELHGFDDDPLWFSMSASASFGFKFVTDRNSTKVMVVPADIDNAEDKDFKIVGVSQLKASYTNLYKVGAYNKGVDYGICDMIVVKTEEVSSKLDHLFKPLTVVKSLETIMNEDGEIVERAYCQQGKAEISFEWKKEDPVDHVKEDSEKFEGLVEMTSNQLEVGDIIQYAVNDENELINFEVYYMYDEANNKYVKAPKFINFVEKDTDGDMRDENLNTVIIPTTVERFDGRNISFYYPPIKAGDAIDNGVAVSGEDTFDYRMIFFQPGFEAVQIIELDEGKAPLVFAGTAADIQIGDEILVQNIWAQTMSVTIIRRR